MKTKTLLLFIFFISLKLSAQEFKTPVDYLSYIGKEQDNISKSMWKYTSAVAHSKSARKIDNTRKTLVKSIETATKKISDLKTGYKGDLEYRNQVLDFLSLSEKNINEEYDKIIDMQEVADQSYDAMEAYILTRDKVNEKIDAEYDKVNLAQKQFALKYNITLTDTKSDLAQKMEISKQVFDYHSVLYLVFFKTNITDLNLSNAIEKKDMAVIQQNAGALQQYADEGLEKLKTIKPFNGDNTLAISTKKALEYYKKEAQLYVPKIVDFLMFNEKFENAKKAMDAKTDKDRTKEEVDNFNGMVKQINKEIDNFNKNNNTNLQDKNNVIDTWNNTADNFISGHVPMD